MSKAPRVPSSHLSGTTHPGGLPVLTREQVARWQTRQVSKWPLPLTGRHSPEGWAGTGPDCSRRVTGTQRFKSCPQRKRRKPTVLRTRALTRTLEGARSRISVWLPCWEGTSCPGMEPFCSRRGPWGPLLKSFSFTDEGRGSPKDDF